MLVLNVIVQKNVENKNLVEKKNSFLIIFMAYKSTYHFSLVQNHELKW